MIQEIIRGADNLEIGRTPDAAFPFDSEYNKITQFSGHEVLAHWHDEFEMIAVKEGEMHYRGDGEERLLRAGQGVFINLNHLHSLAQHASHDCRYLVTIFRPSMLDGREDGQLYRTYVYPFVLGNHMFYDIPLSVDVPWQAELMQLQLALFNAYTGKEPGYEFFIHRHLLLFWELLYKNDLAFRGEDSGSAQKKREIYQALHFIQTHYRDKIYLKDIAAACHLSSTECNRIFHKQVSMSPMEYVIRYRVSRSLPLLVNREMSIVEAASAVGFDNHSYFTRTFRRYMNCTPKEYRLQS